MAHSALGTPARLAVVDLGTGEIRDVPAEVANVASDVAVSPDGSRIYISGTQSGDDVLVEIDAESEAVERWLPTGAGNDGIVIAPSGATAFVAQFGSVFEVDLATGSMSDIVAQHPFSSTTLVLSADGSTLYVFGGMSSGDTEGRALVIDAASHQMLANVAIGPGSVSDALFAPDGSRVFLARRVLGESPTARIDVLEPATNSVSSVLPNVEGDVRNFAVAPAGNRLWYTGNTLSNSATMRIVDLTTDGIEQTIAVQTAFVPLAIQGTRAIDFSADGAWAYVALGISHIAVIDVEAGQMTALLDIGGFVEDLAVVP